MAHIYTMYVLYVPVCLGVRRKLHTLRFDCVSRAVIENGGRLSLIRDRVRIYCGFFLYVYNCYLDRKKFRDCYK